VLLTFLVTPPTNFSEFKIVNTTKSECFQKKSFEPEAFPKRNTGKKQNLRRAGREPSNSSTQINGKFNTNHFLTKKNLKLQDYWDSDVLFFDRTTENLSDNQARVKTFFTFFVKLCQTNGKIDTE
jgi:hypothetical protein